jgi:hypothetical protein
VLDNQVGEQAQECIVVKDVYVQFTDRLIPYARFATKYMDRQTAKHYMRCMRHIHAEVLNNAQSMVCIELILGEIKQAMLVLPLTKTSLKDTFNGEMHAEVAGRKLALEQAMDLAISYRRFDGLTPMSKHEDFLKWYAKDALVNNLESLLKK